MTESPENPERFRDLPVQFPVAQMALTTGRYDLTLEGLTLDNRPIRGIEPAWVVRW